MCMHVPESKSALTECHGELRLGKIYIGQKSLWANQFVYACTDYNLPHAIMETENQLTWLLEILEAFMLFKNAWAYFISIDNVT